MTPDDLRELDAALDDLNVSYGPSIRQLEEKDPMRRAIDRLLNAWSLVDESLTETEPTEVGPSTSRHVDGASFVFSVPETVPALWGDGNTVAWAQGEGLMLVGPDGVGKTTLGQQLMLARLGLRDDLLGMPVTPAAGRLLYIAADRPRQAASSLRRMVGSASEDVLRERVSVWRGPIPVDVIKQPRALLDWIRTEFDDISDVYLDSLKDIAFDLVKDEVGGRVNSAFQELIAEGIELAAFHHQRKEQQGGAKPRRLADVYGSRWLTAGMGSVVLLWGEPGDIVVDLSHLKQPVETFGPHQLIHDHQHGATSIYQLADLLTSLSNSANGLTVADAARLMFGEEKPEANQIERARRRLNSYLDKGEAARQDDADGLARYVATKTPAHGSENTVTPTVTPSRSAHATSQTAHASLTQPHARTQLTRPYKDKGQREANGALVPGDNGYLAYLFNAFEAGHVTEPEWHELTALHTQLAVTA